MRLQLLLAEKNAERTPHHAVKSDFSGCFLANLRPKEVLYTVLPRPCLGAGLGRGGRFASHPLDRYAHLAADSYTSKGMVGLSHQGEQPTLGRPCQLLPKPTYRVRK